MVEPTNQVRTKVPKIFKPTCERTVHEIFSTRVIYSFIVPALVVIKENNPNKLIKLCFKVHLLVTLSNFINVEIISTIQIKYLTFSISQLSFNLVSFNVKILLLSKLPKKDTRRFF